MSDDRNLTVGSLHKETYEPPLLTRHQPLLDVTGKSAAKESKESSDTSKTKVEVKSVTENIGANPKTTDTGNKNGSPEKGSKAENEKTALTDQKTMDKTTAG